MQSAHSRTSDGDERQFSILSQTWHAIANQSPAQREAGEDEITVGFSRPDGSSGAGFRIVWKRVEGKLASELCASSDSWPSLSRFSDVLEQLATFNGATPSVEDIAKVLRSCGVRDATDRSYPIRAKEGPPRVHTVATLMAPHATSLANLRVLGRVASGYARWAENAEFGEPLVPAPGIPDDIFCTMQSHVHEFMRLRQKLIEAVGNDAWLARQYGHLLNPPGK